MTKLLTSFTNHFHIIITVIFSLIILYIIARPYYLQFYFENALGRTALLFFIIAMTLCNPVMGIFSTVIFIGLYNSRVIEGVENMDSVKIEVPTVDKKDKEIKSTETTTGDMKPSKIAEASDDKTPGKSLDPKMQQEEVTKDMPDVKQDKKIIITDKKANKEAFGNRILSPMDLNEGRNRMLTIEDYIRKPKSSNQMPFSKYYESRNEPIPNYPGTEGMQSTPSVR
jgi:hypothetical protein